eukprot:754815-Hanusia_phi.AAC.1
MLRRKNTPKTAPGKRTAVSSVLRSLSVPAPLNILQNSAETCRRDCEMRAGEEGGGERKVEGREGAGTGEGGGRGRGGKAGRGGGGGGRARGTERGAGGGGAGGAEAGAGGAGGHSRILQGDP